MSEEVNEVDAMLLRREALKTQIIQLQAVLQETESAINALAGDPEKMTGTVYAEGREYRAKIVRKVYISYSDKQKLSAILTANEALAELYRIDVRESGTKVEKWLDANKDTATAAEVLAIRVVKPGKPEIVTTKVEAE